MLPLVVPVGVGVGVVGGLDGGEGVGLGVGVVVGGDDGVEPLGGVTGVLGLSGVGGVGVEAGSLGVAGGAGGVVDGGGVLDAGGSEAAGSPGGGVEICTGPLATGLVVALPGAVGVLDDVIPPTGLPGPGAEVLPSGDPGLAPASPPEVCGDVAGVELSNPEEAGSTPIVGPEASPLSRPDGALARLVVTAESIDRDEESMACDSGVPDPVACTSPNAPPPAASTAATGTAARNIAGRRGPRCRPPVTPRSEGGRSSPPAGRMAASLAGRRTTS